MAKLVDKPFNFLKWKYFPHSIVSMILLTLFGSFFITKFIYDNFIEYFYLYEQNIVLKFLIDIENGWFYAFIFLITINFLIGLISFSNNVSIRLLIFGIGFSKLYVFISEINLIFYYLDYTNEITALCIDISIISFFIIVGSYIFYSYIKKY